MAGAQLVPCDLGGFISTLGQLRMKFSQSGTPEEMHARYSVLTQAIQSHLFCEGPGHVLRSVLAAAMSSKGYHALVLSSLRLLSKALAQDTDPVAAALVTTAGTQTVCELAQCHPDDLKVLELVCEVLASALDATDCLDELLQPSGGLDSVLTLITTHAPNHLRVAQLGAGLVHSAVQVSAQRGDCTAARQLLELGAVGTLQSCSTQVTAHKDLETVQRICGVATALAHPDTLTALVSAGVVPLLVCILKGSREARIAATVFDALQHIATMTAPVGGSMPLDEFGQAAIHAVGTGLGLGSAAQAALPYSNIFGHFCFVFRWRPFRG